METYTARELAKAIRIGIETGEIARPSLDDAELKRVMLELGEAHQKDTGQTMVELILWLTEHYKFTPREAECVLATYCLACLMAKEEQEARRGVSRNKG